MRRRDTRLRLIINSTQIRDTDTPVLFAHSTMERIPPFCSTVSHVPSIAPTNPHSFFLRIAGSTACSAGTRSFSSRSPFRASHRRTRALFWIVPRDDQPNAQGRLPSPSHGCEAGRWNRGPHDATPRPQVMFRSGFPKISDTSSQATKTAAS